MHTYIHTYTQRFDLKGSTLGRMATLEERNQRGVIYKDRDALMYQRKFKMGAARKETFEAQVCDCICMCLYVYGVIYKDRNALMYQRKFKMGASREETLEAQV